LKYGLEELRSSGISEPEPDVYLLLCATLNKTRTELFLAAGEQVSTEEKKNFLQALSRRKKREPVAYILGEREFWSLPFTVSKDVLIPRPETEFLLETVLNRINKDEIQLTGSVVDVCCGSGVIAVVLALELKTQVVAVDISRRALTVAQKNAKRHLVDKQVSFIQADLMTGIQSRQDISLIVSNPPYVADHEIVNMIEPEVAEHEPHLALDGGVKGLEIIQRLRIELRGSLAPGGNFFLEIGADQGQEVMELFSKPYQGSKPFDFVEIVQDYAGRDRVVYGGLKP